MNTQLFGGPLEVSAEAQEVTRADGVVRVRVTLPFGLMPGTSWRLKLAEPVSVQAGESIVVEARYQGPGYAGMHTELAYAAPEGATVDAVFSVG